MLTGLLDVSAAKAYLEVDHDDDDGLIGDLVIQGEALLEERLQRRVFAGTSPGDDITEFFDGGVGRFFLEHYPVKTASPALIVTDTKGTLDTADDEVFDTDLYRLDDRQGVVTRTSNAGDLRIWGQGHRRWKVVYLAGLDLDPHWDARIMRVLQASLRDLVAHWYENRNPGARSVADGRGVKVELDTKNAIPLRICAIWDTYRTLR